jgi:transposase
VLRTSVKKEQLSADQTVLSYKGLSAVERVFRSCKSMDLHIRPIHHLADRVRAHVLICMLAFHVEWHMRQKLAPLLFDDEQPGRRDGSVVSPARRSTSALTKARTKRTADDFPVQSFQDWLKDLATVTRNRVQPSQSVPAFDVITRPTPAQRRAFGSASPYNAGL